MKEGEYTWYQYPMSTQTTLNVKTWLSLGQIWRLIIKFKMKWLTNGLGQCHDYIENFMRCQTLLHEKSGYHHHLHTFCNNINCSTIKISVFAPIYQFIHSTTAKATGISELWIIKSSVWGWWPKTDSTPILSDLWACPEVVMNVKASELSLCVWEGWVRILPNANPFHQSCKYEWRLVTWLLILTALLITGGN